MANSSISSRRGIDHAIIEMLSSVVNSSNTGGMNDVIGYAAKGGACDSAVLWQLGPYNSSSDMPSIASYFPVAQWPSEPPLPEAQHNSLLGRATRENKTIDTDLVDDCKQIGSPQSKYICAVPITSSIEAAQVLTFHRNSGPRFRQGTKDRLANLGKLIPLVETAMHHNVGYISSRSIAEAFDHKGGEIQLQVLPSLIKDICLKIKSFFRAVEVSIFLSRESNSNIFDLVGSTWNGQFKTHSYSVGNPSLTSYVVSHNKPVRIADLRHFGKDRIRIQRQYPNLGWSDALDIANSLGKLISPVTPISFIAAPITFAGSVKGAIRCCAMLGGPFYFTDHDLRLLQFLATRIAQHLEANIRLRAAHERVISTQHNQAQAFEDVAHQLRSPAETAHHILARLMKDPSLSPPVLAKLRAAKGLVARARRVTKSTGLFANLVIGHSIELRLQPLTYSRLTDLLSELTSDLEALIQPQREIRVLLDTKSLDAISRVPVSADIGLLEQAIASILDNAGKYSFPKTTIRVSAGITTSGRFNISVSSRGLKIRPDDIRHVGERGWRGDWARQFTSEGSGIGLWLVDNIMKAHGGELQVMPTTQEGDTEVKLILPRGRSL